jgi:hypothetical protein
MAEQLAEELAMRVQSLQAILERAQR